MACSDGSSACDKSVIPAMWKTCSDFHKTIPNSPFLPCRSPMKAELSSELTPEKLVSGAAAAGLGSVKLVVDLNTHEKFYSAQDLQPTGAKHLKIGCEAMKTPTEEAYATFRDAVKAFAKANPSDLVAVHCTCGKNRAGFLVARYLIEEGGMEPAAAVAAYSEARGIDVQLTEDMSLYKKAA